MAPPVYLVDFSVYCPNKDQRVCWEYHRQNSMTVWEKYGVTRDKIDFCDRIIRGSGISDDMAALPAWLQPDKSDSPKTDMIHAGREARMVQGWSVADVLRKTGVEPRDIDILVTNCSIYCPTPSMSAMLVNMFGMREDIQAYHLGGMGCAMGVVGLNLVRDLLAARPNSTALFVSNEVVTAGFYVGDRKEALITNSLFRMGGSAAILTNRPSWRFSAKYELCHVNRVHTGRYPRSFGCLSLEPDEQGLNGMVITKDLPSEAALALNKAIGAAAPTFMTWRQYAEAAMHFAHDAVAKATGVARPGNYQPDFTKCIDKFLIHAGGYAILQAVKKGMKLPADKMMPSFVSLRDYGNTSSASTWYTWSYIEACEGVAPHQRVLQIGVGGGMKAGVAVWRALRRIQDKDAHPAWAHLEGRVQTEADLRRPITVAYKSVYDAKKAREEAAKLQAGGGAGGEAGSGGGGHGGGGGAGKEKMPQISFEPAKEPRVLLVKSWREVGEDRDEWWRAPPGQPLAGAAGNGEGEGGKHSAAAAAAARAAAIAATSAAAAAKPACTAGSPVKIVAVAE